MNAERRTMNLKASQRLNRSPLVFQFGVHRPYFRVAFNGGVL
jgi:hypothetical protein